MGDHNVEHNRKYVVWDYFNEGILIPENSISAGRIVFRYVNGLLPILLD